MIKLSKSWSSLPRLLKVIPIFLVVGQGTVRTLMAQRFPEPIAIPYQLVQVGYGSVDFVDFDNDGDLDLLVAGLRGGQPISKLYRLEDSTFTIADGEKITSHQFKVYRDAVVVLSQVWQSSTSWGDYDGDGDADLAIMGLTEIDKEVGLRVIEPVARVVENRAGRFEPDGAVKLPQVFNGGVDWGDFDMDGDVDLVIAGSVEISPPYNPVTRVFANEAGALSETQISLPGIVFGTVKWIDFDLDGDLDLTLMGRSEDDTIITSIYRNDAGTFASHETGLPRLVFGSIDWADYDLDGDPDLLLTGGLVDPLVLRGYTGVFRNDGGGQLRYVDTGLPGILAGKAKWTDFDSDGDLDVVLAGSRTAKGQLEAAIYLNDSGIFTMERSLGPLRFADISAGDYNGDGDADFIITGVSDDGAPRVFFHMNRIFPEILPPDLFPR